MKNKANHLLLPRLSQKQQQFPDEAQPQSAPTPETPPSLSTRITLKLIQSPPSASHVSPSFSSHYSPQPHSLSACYPSSVCGSSSLAGPTSQELCLSPFQLPLPPLPSSNLLRRTTVFDHAPLLPLPKGSSLIHPVFRNLMNHFPPSPSNLLRRTVSGSVSSLNSNSKEEAEKLSGEWIGVKFNCECSKQNHFLVNATNKRYVKLL